MLHIFHLDPLLFDKIAARSLMRCFLQIFGLLLLGQTIPPLALRFWLFFDDFFLPQAHPLHFLVVYFQVQALMKCIHAGIVCMKQVISILPVRLLRHRPGHR